MDQEKNSAALNEAIPALDVDGNNANAVVESQENHGNTIDFTTFSLGEIIDRFTELLDNEDHSELFKYADILKSAFYKVLRREKGQSHPAMGQEDHPDSMIEDPSDPFSEVENRFKELYSRYKADKQVFAQHQEEEREANYQAKLQVIEDLKALLEKAEDVNVTFPAFRELQNRWKSIDMVPQSKAKDIWESYQLCVEKFYDYIKINNEFRDLDFKKNLEAKTALCEKAEALENEPNIVVAFKELQKLHDEWKELGPVAKEYRESIWERFKAITSTINKKHQHFFEKLKEDQKNNLEAKSALCEQAEEIAQANPEESNEWNSLSKKMEELQAQWKTIGFAAKKDNQKIYDRFRAACDKFYNAKREYYANFKNVMQENLKRKEELCEQAEALMESEDWKKATDQLINLQKVWKEVGPVARKQSDLVWKRFRAACDHFFEKKSQHFGKVDEEYGQNLALKLALIEEIKAYEVGATKDEDIKAMREFQRRWNEIGFVPFKDKEKVQNAFNNAMDAHFEDIRSLDSEKKMKKFRRMVVDARNTAKGEKGVKFEREKLLRRYRKMEQDIATLENNMGFFAKSKNADSMIADIEKKIAIAKEELAQIEEKIKIIDKQFE